MSYRIVTLYSGSGGNCTLISAAGTSILIDAGKSARALCCALRSVGSDISQIDAIFITHEHCDHISALEMLCKKHSIPVHMTAESSQKFDRYPDSPVHSTLIRHIPQFCEQVGALKVSSFRTSHDSNMSVGYRIEYRDGEGEHALGIATDTGYAPKSVFEGLRGCEAVVLESNHDEEMLESGPYPYHLKVRIRSARGHLSNAACAELAASLAASGTRAFILAHLSEENNRPELALDETVCAISDPSVTVLVASPTEPVELCAPSFEEEQLCLE